MSKNKKITKWNHESFLLSPLFTDSMEKEEREEIHVHYKTNTHTAQEQRGKKGNLERHAESCIITTRFQSPCSLQQAERRNKRERETSSHEAKGKKLKCIKENKSKNKRNSAEGRLIETSPKVTAKTSKEHEYHATGNGVRVPSLRCVLHDGEE